MVVSVRVAGIQQIGMNEKNKTTLSIKMFREFLSDARM